MQISSFFILLFAGLGILNTLYLIYHKISGTPVKCIGFSDEWCEKVQNSTYSKIMGIPNSYLGFLMYVAILVLTLTSHASITPFWPVAGLIVGGFLFSMYFVFIQAVILKAYCTWCVLSAIDFVALLIILLVRLFY